MEKEIAIIVGVYVTAMAVMDVRKREIPVLPGVCCVVAIAALQLLGKKGWTEWVPGVLVGLLLWLTCKVSHGAVGEGDALVYLVLGVAQGFVGSIEILMVSLCLAAVVGIGMMIGRRVGRNYAMPFIPFTAAAYGMVVFL